jgi:hypothetical protein
VSEARSTPTRSWLAPLGAAVLALLVAAPGVFAGWAGWDDDRYILHNPIRQAPLGECLGWAVSGVRFQAYHPVHLALSCVEMAAFDDRPGPYHGVSMLLLAGLAAAVATWLAREGLGRGAAVLGAGLAVAHPLMVEAHAAPISQKDLLGLLFVAVALAVRAGRPEARDARHRLGLAALVALAALSKSGYAVLGAVLVARDVKLGGRPLGAAIRDQAAPLAVGTLGLGLALWIVTREGLPASGAPWLDPQVMGATLSHYAHRFVIPLDLTPVQCLDPSGLRAVLGWVIGLAVLGAAVALPGRLGLAAWLVVLGLLPFANAVPTPLLVSSRFATWLPLAAGLAIAGAGPRLVRGLGGLILVAWMAISVDAGLRWTDPVTLWTWTADVSRCVAVPYANLAVALFESGRRPAAEEALINAIGVEPHAEKLYRDLALAFWLSGDCGPPVPPGEAQALHRRAGEVAGAEVMAAKRGWLASALVLALRRHRDAPSIPAPVRGLLPNVQACDPARGRRVQVLIEGLEARRAATSPR